MRACTLMRHGPVWRARWVDADGTPGEYEAADRQRVARVLHAVTDVWLGLGPAPTGGAR